MALAKDSKIAFVLKSQKEVSLLASAFGEEGYRKTTAFVDSHEAYEFLIRHQFDLLVVRMEMPDLTGIVLMQKLRASGNYGTETVLFIVEQLDPGIANILFELDIRYVLTSLENKQLIKEKVIHLIHEENNLSEFEIKYREARSALYNNIDDLAYNIALELYEHSPKDERVCISLGDIYSKQKDMRKMAGYYTLALKINPNSAIAAHKLGYCHMLVGDFEKSAKVFRKLAELNPYHLKMLENAGLSHLRIQEYEKALEYSGKMTAIDVTNKTATELSADVYIAQGDYASMAQALKKTHSDKELISYLNTAGVKLAQGDDVVGALNIYRYCTAHLADNPHLYAVYFNIALAQMKLDNKEAAYEALNTCLSLNPDFSKARIYLEKLNKVA